MNEQVSRNSQVLKAEIRGLARVSTIEEIAALNTGKMLVIGEKYRICRSNGIIDDGWQLIEAKGNKLMLCKADFAA